MVRKLLIILSISLFGQTISAEEVRITGHAPQLTGKYIQLARVNDYITQTETILEELQIDQDGRFSFQLDIEQTEQLLLKIGNNIHLVYAVPGEEYILEIPDLTGEELYYPNNTDSTALYYLVSRLNYDFNYFNINNYDKFIAGTVRGDAAKFILKTKKKYAWVENPFFQTLMKYKIAELQYVTRLKGENNIYETYFKEEPVLFSHPEYMYFFNEFYEGIMFRLVKSNRDPRIGRIIKDGTPYDSLLSIVQTHKWIPNQQMAELFILRGLYELYYKAGYDRYKIENLLIEQEGRTESEEVKAIIKSFKTIINRLKPGSHYTPFEGKMADGTVVKSEDLTDKPIYLVFFSPDDPNSIKEVPAINNLYSSFKREIRFVAVCGDCTYSKLQDFIQAHKIKFTCLTVDPSLESEYEVLKYPSAFLLDKEGIFNESPAKLPSEGVDQQIYLLTRKGRRQR